MSRNEPLAARLPIKLDSTSNGEFCPVALPRAARVARAFAQADIVAAARRVALSRRRYLTSLLGAPHIAPGALKLTACCPEFGTGLGICLLQRR